MSRALVFHDWEFHESGLNSPLRPISLGMVHEDGRELYLEFSSFSSDRLYREWLEALPAWHQENILPHLAHYTRHCGCVFVGPVGPLLARAEACPLVDYVTGRERILAFLGEEKILPAAYFGDYDHVLLAGMFGTMMEMPSTVAKWTYDIKQLCYELGDPQLPKYNNGVEHNALADARWVRDTYHWLRDYQKTHQQQALFA